MLSAARKTILIVEDHPGVGNELERLLGQEGLAAVLAANLALARRERAQRAFDGAILDVNLPDGTGFQLCREIRETDTSLPILFLTDRGDEDSIVKGLAFAGTDYLRKPFVRGELISRLRRLLKLHSGVLTVGDLVVNLDERKVKWKGSPVTLSPRELDILGLLVSHFGKLVTRERIVERLADSEIDERTVNSYLSRLKSKLSAAGVTGFKVEAVYGEGYRLEKA